MGHFTGDQVLVQTAERIRATIGHGDLLARLGEDEFVAMLADTTLETPCSLSTACAS